MCIINRPAESIPPDVAVPLGRWSCADTDAMRTCRPLNGTDGGFLPLLACDATDV